LDVLDIAVLRALRRYGFQWPGWNDDGVDLFWTTDPATGLVTDGRDAYLTQVVVRACLRTRDPRTATEAAWSAFRLTTDLSRLRQDERPWRLVLSRLRQDERPWRLVDAQNRVPAVLRRFSAFGVPLNIRAAEEGAAGHAGHPADLPPQEAQARLEAALASFENEVGAYRRGERKTPPRVGIKTTVGLGKTTSTARLLAREAADDRTVWVFMPSLPLASDFAETARAAVAKELARRGKTLDRDRVTLIRGRGANANDPERFPALCAKEDVAAAVARAGLPVFDTLCEQKIPHFDMKERCPFFETCGWVRQWADTGKGQIVIFAHTYLALPKGRAAAQPDVVMIDEGFVGQFIRSTSVPIDALDRPRDAQSRVPYEEAVLHRERCTRLEAVLRDGKHPRDAGLTKADLEQMAKVETRISSIGRLPLSPRMPVEEQKSVAKKVADNVGRRVAKLLSVLADDFDRETPSVRAYITSEKRDGEMAESPGLRFIETPVCR
jgi:hypothetical protein